MKTVLVKCKIEEEDGSKPCITPPVGLWSMRQNSPDITVVDLNIERENEIVADEIGFSLSFPSQRKSLSRMMDICQSPRIIFGGPHGSTLPGGWAGPGENYFDRTVTFGELDYPLFTEEEMEPYWKQDKPFGQKFSGRWFPIETSRGCNHRCGYCDMPKFWGGWQPKAVEQIEAYVEWLKKKRGIDQLIILDDNISYDKERFLRIIEVFDRYDMSWTCPNGIYSRSLMDANVIDKLGSAKALSLPFETGCARTAKTMRLGNKWLCFSGAFWLVAKLKERGIHTTGFFIIGYPGETEEDVKETLAYANALPLNERYIYFATPYAGTHLYDICMTGGYLKEPVEKATYKNPIIETPLLSRERLKELWTADRENALRRKGI